MKRFTLTLLTILLSIGAFATTPPISPSSGGVCIGSYLYLNDSLAGAGTWASSNTAIATVGTSGTLLGVSAGVVTITFTTGTGYATGTYTVSAVPAAIGGGPTTFCVGGTATFTDATPGGVWSTSAYTGSASINSSTGVATGLTPGVIWVHYTVGGGCTVSSLDTVIGAIAPLIVGPTHVCVGSTITLTDSTGGGSITWSSSSTSIATVGASSGVVTGVSNGTVTITATVSGGACGTAYSTYTITVGPVAPGSVVGTGALSVGATSAFNYYGLGTGGTWSISPTSVATIDASGNVTGVSVGTAIVTYSFVSCGITEYATASVGIVSIDGISGHVIFSSAYYGNVKVWLINYNPGTGYLSALDSVSVYCSGTSIYYQFTGLATDSFRVKAAIYDSTGSTTGFIPTYHSSFYYWHDASVINHTAGTSDINEDITMLTGTTSSGPGFISGNVLTGANRGTSSSIPSVGLRIVCMNTSTSTIMEMARTDASGNYTLSSLPYGTYTVFPDSLNYMTTPYTTITLSASASSYTTGHFVQHTLSKTITPDPLAITNLVSVSSVSAFPNPTTGRLHIQWNEKAAEKGMVSISDITGREVYKTTLNMNEGTGITAIDLSALNNGLYMISIKSASLNYISKIEIAH